MPKITTAAGPTGQGAPPAASTFAREDGVEVPVLPLCYPTGASNQYVWTSDANGNGSWQAAAGGAPTGNAGGDLGSTYPNPTVTATHLASALPVAQGGTGSTSRNFTGLMTPTAVKTSAYNAVAGDFVPVDTTSGSVTVTLPTAPADLTVIGIKHVIQGGTNTVTYATGGSDVFNKAGGGTSGTLTLLSQGVILQYNASGAIWYVFADDLPLTQLDSRYLKASSNLSDVGSQQTALDNVAGAVTSGSYLRGNGSHVSMSAIQAADLPTGTTSTKGALQLDGTAGDITVAGTQTAGSTGLVADAGHIHPAMGQWIPADNGLLGANFPLSSVDATGAALTAGTLYLVKLPIRRAVTITTLWIIQSNSGSGASTGSFVGLYNSAGTLLTGSSDTGTGFTNFTNSYNVTTPQALSAGTFVWAALLSNLASTQPQWVCGYNSANNANVPNINVTAANYLFAVNGTGLTSLPGSITPSSNSKSGPAQGIWVGFA